MKRFRFYLTPLVTVPQKLASGYSKADLAELYERYQARLLKHRSREKIVAGVAVTTIICAIVVAFGPDPWNGICFGLCLVGFLVLMTMLPTRLPCCPGCENDVDTAIGAFCPECGKQTIQRAGWLSEPQCTSCDLQVRHGGKRQYRILACTHCGLTLDRNGL